MIKIVRTTKGEYFNPYTDRKEMAIRVKGLIHNQAYVVLIHTQWLDIPDEEIKSMAIKEFRELYRKDWLLIQWRRFCYWLHKMLKGQR